MGTFHSIGKSFIDSIPVIKTALLNAEVAIFESVDEEKNLADALQNRNKQNRLRQLLNKEDHAKLVTISKDWKTSIFLLTPIEILVTLRREFQMSKCKTVKPTDQWDHLIIT